MCESLGESCVQMGCGGNTANAYVSEFTCEDYNFTSTTMQPCWQTLAVNDQARCCCTVTP